MLLDAKMKRASLHTLVVMLVALAAVFVMASPEDLREYESAYVRQEGLKESAESIAAHRDPQAVDSGRFGDSIKNRCSLHVPAMMAPLALVCLSTCVLLC